MFGPDRHTNLAAALPLGAGASVVDLGCGSGPTLTTLAARPDSPSRLVGVDLKRRALPSDRFDLTLTRRLVHHFCDTVQPWMVAGDGTVGRRLVALGRRSPLELTATYAWVAHHTTFEPGSPARDAALLVAADGRRDDELRDHVDGWLRDLDEQAERGEFLYSINDYAVLLRKTVTSSTPDAAATLAGRPAVGR